MVGFCLNSKWKYVKKIERELKKETKQLETEYKKKQKQLEKKRKKVNNYKRSVLQEVAGKPDQGRMRSKRKELMSL